jgi:sugar phosphate isomerase/epimerase
MQALRDMEIGVMFWAQEDPVATIRDAKSLGVRCGQLCIPGDLHLDGAGHPWRTALASEQFTVGTVFCAYSGESYADIPTVKNTVGFIPETTRLAREARTLAVSDFAAAIGVHGIGCHVGFVPEDRTDPGYIAVREVVRRICDHAASHGQTFALETGQEPADVLLKFLNDVDRSNIGINFDPANMVLYGTGDPIQALDILGPRVISVHCKDGVWPPKNVDGALGTEMPLGQGDVDMPRFIAKLKQIGFRGPLNVEREVEDPERRKVDIRKGIELLNKLRD